MYLYLNTAYKQSFGILDESFEWKSLKSFDLAKASESFHFEIHQELESLSCELKEVKAVFYCAGPGSYTGMRLSHVISSYLEQEGIPVYSFYLHEVPALLEIPKGTFISNAYKGESFVYSWPAPVDEFKLVKQVDLGDISDSIDSEAVLIKIKDQSKDLFPIIESKSLSRELFYYRSLEQEFKKK